MSAKAEKMRTRRHIAAAPGSKRDSVIKVLSVALPSAIGALVAFLVLAPLTNSGEVSFLLDKNKVEIAKDRLRVSNAEYRGEDSSGRAFSLKAGSAVQRTSLVPVVEMDDLVAQIMLSTGLATLTARNGAYDMDEETVMVDGPVEFDGPDGYRIETSDVNIDLKARQMESRGEVSGQVPSGTFRADKLRADLGKREVVLQGNARFRMRPGSKSFGM